MGVIVRLDLNGVKFLEGCPQVKELLQKVQWLEFVENFDGHEKEVTKYFSWAYDGIESDMGDVKVVFT